MASIRCSTAAATLLALVLLAGCNREAPSPAANAGDRATNVSVDAAAMPATPTTAPTTARSIDARPLVGQAEAGVQAMLGAPRSCEDVAQGRRCTYARGAEVTYIDGMADHMVIADLQGAAFEPATIARIGLAGAEPLEVGDDAIRWQNVGGVREIVLERGADGRAGRFVIKAMTP